MSPVIPPPTEIKQSSREKFLSSKIFKIEFTVFKFLFFSLALTLRKKNFLSFKDFTILEINLLGTLLSLINKHF